MLRGLFALALVLVAVRRWRAYVKGSKRHGGSGPRQLVDGSKEAVGLEECCCVS